MIDTELTRTEDALLDALGRATEAVTFDGLKALLDQMHATLDDDMVRTAVWYLIDRNLVAFTADRRLTKIGDERE